MPKSGTIVAVFHRTKAVSDAEVVSRRTICTELLDDRLPEGVARLVVGAGEGTLVFVSSTSSSTGALWRVYSWRKRCANETSTASARGRTLAETNTSQRSSERTRQARGGGATPCREAMGAMVEVRPSWVEVLRRGRPTLLGGPSGDIGMARILEFKLDMEQYDRERPLFDRRFHVLVQYPDRDEKLQPLTIRLLNGVRQNVAKNQKERVFRVEITDDDGVDPYFLYLWSVSEEEFHELKQQQRLLVDFQSFPSNLIELLQCCLKDSKAIRDGSTYEDDQCASGEEQDEDAGTPGTTDIRDSNTQLKQATSRSQGPVPLSYLAVLNTRDAKGESMFSIVETNPFKYLTHLSLQFFPGDDAAIKAYLAARLAQVNGEKKILSMNLGQTSTDLRRTRTHEQELEKRLETLSQQTESELAREKMKFSDDLNSERSKAAATLKAREDELNAKIESLTEKYESELQSLRRKGEDNDAQIQNLSKIKYQQELQIEQLITQSKDLSTGKSSLSDEVQALRSENKSLDERAFQQEKQINQLEMKIAALNQQVADKEEVIAKTTELLHGAQLHKQEIEESLKMYRDNHARLQSKLELSVSEINKGNEIIERIQNENRTLKAKMKMKGKILKQQEQLIDEKQMERDETASELKSVREDVRKRDDQIASLKERVHELTTKLEESNKLLASNQQVITWLNKEINEAQIAHHRRSSAHPQVYSYRPPTNNLGDAPSVVRPTPTFNASISRP